MIISKKDGYIQDLVEYVGNVFGENPEIFPMDKEHTDRLPLSLRAGFSFYHCTLMGQAVVFVIPKEKSVLLTPKQTEKYIQIFSGKFNEPIIMVLNNVPAYNIQRLIAKRINFIIPGKQMFIPELLLDLRKPKQIDNDLKESMPAIAQCLLLYHLQIALINGMTTQDVARLFNISYANANRAVRWLYNHELLALVAERGKEKSIEIIYSKKELWDKASPLFTNPIRKIMYAVKPLENLMISGINALSEYTMIQPTDTFNYAVSMEDFKDIKAMTTDCITEYVVEIWQYNPRLLSITNIVDKLSLYLTLMHDEDERVQIELEQIINEQING